MIRQLNSTWGTLVFKDDRSHVLLLPRTPSSPVYDPHTRQGRIRALSFRMVWEHWLEGTALPVHRHCAQCRKPTEDRGPRRTEARGGQGPAEDRGPRSTGVCTGQGPAEDRGGASVWDGRGQECRPHRQPGLLSGRSWVCYHGKHDAPFSLPASLLGRPAGGRSAPSWAQPLPTCKLAASPTWELLQVLFRPCAAGRDFPLTVLQLRMFLCHGASSGNF